jgi:hypothetical protein
LLVSSVSFFGKIRISALLNGSQTDVKYLIAAYLAPVYVESGPVRMDYGEAATLYVEAVCSQVGVAKFFLQCN